MHMMTFNLYNSIEHLFAIQFNFDASSAHLWVVQAIYCQANIRRNKLNALTRNEISKQNRKQCL